MKVVGQIVAACSGWIVLHLAKAVCRAGSHRTGLVSGQVNNIDAQAMCGVMHAGNNRIPGVHEQVLRPVGSEGRRRRVDRIGGCLRVTALGDEGEVDVLWRAKHVVHARVILLCPGDWVLRQAVDVQRGAPFLGVAANPGRPRYPTGGIELHLHKSRPRVL